MNKEELKKEIEKVKESIETEKSFNSNSGNLSFLYYQLHELERELNKEEEKRNDE